MVFLRVFLGVFEKTKEKKDSVLHSFALFCAHLRVSASDRVWNERVWELQSLSSFSLVEAQARPLRVLSLLRKDPQGPAKNRNNKYVLLFSEVTFPFGPRNKDWEAHSGALAIKTENF